MRLLQTQLWLLGLAVGAVVLTTKQVRPPRKGSVVAGYSPSDGEENLKTVQNLISDTETLAGDVGKTLRSANELVSKIAGVLGSMKGASSAIVNVVNDFVPGVSSGLVSGLRNVNCAAGCPKRRPYTKWSPVNFTRPVQTEVMLANYSALL